MKWRAICEHKPPGRPYTIADVSGKLVMCLNEQQRKDLRESRYDEINNAQKLLQQGKTIKHGLEKYFDSKGNVILKEVQKAEEFDGYSVIFTTVNLAKEQVVKMYFEKDLVEKAFQSLKGVTRLRPIRHWLYNRVIAHVFVCYLSYLILTLMQIKLTGLSISAPQALEELDTMYRVHLRDKHKKFKLTKIVTLNKKQEKILKAIDAKLLKEIDTDSFM
jgi:transposase